MNKIKLILAGILSATPACAGEPPRGFARLADVAPGVAQDMRYARADNFTGRPVPGYRAAQCWLRAEAAAALAAAQADAHARGFDLVVFDCYRPRRAVAAFVDWSKSPDEHTKPAFYPHVEKRTLFAEGYIAAQSTHSTGLAVDLGVRGWDFGTPFDFFDKRSWTQAQVSPQARANREALVSLMRRHGFQNYAREWWHYSFPADNPASYDVEVE